MNSNELNDKPCSSRLYIYFQNDSYKIKNVLDKPQTNTIKHYFFSVLVLMRLGVIFDDSNQIISNIELAGFKKSFLVENSIVSISVFVPCKSRSLSIRWRRVLIELFNPPNKIAICFHIYCYHRAEWFACIALMQRWDQRTFKTTFSYVIDTKHARLYIQANFF